MQLQSQIMRENTRVLTDVQDVTSDASICNKYPAKTAAKCRQGKQDAVHKRSGLSTWKYQFSYDH